MFLCSKCGSQVPEVLASCQYCGTPLPSVTNAANRAGANGYAPKQPELPAWLETLRSSERPPAPAGNESFYALPGPIDENALPGWMRSDKIDNSAKLPAMRPASRPAPNTEGSVLHSAGMSASSLIDEQSLPLWMQEPPQPSQARQENISAASLVQQEALPDWMKAASSQATHSPHPSYPAQVQQVTPPVSRQIPAASTPPVAPRQQLSGNDLIDQQSLPSWMSAHTPDIAAPGNTPGSMTAGSLIDQNALPTWLREGVQQEQRRDHMVPPVSSRATPGLQPVQSVQPVQPVQHTRPVQPAQPAQPAAMNNSISASSFIDVNALPGWLRTAEEPQNGGDTRNGSSNEQSKPGTFGNPARVQNVRVPGRPRAEMPSLEESTVAANVFASMLGVASANLPGQAPVYSTQPVQPTALPASNPNNGLSSAGNPGNGNWSGFPDGTMPAQLPPLVPPAGYGLTASQETSNAQNSYGAGVPGISQQPVMGNFQSNQPYQQNSAMPQQPMGNSFQNRPPAGGQTGSQTESQQKQAGKKRGFLETILNWFPFSR